MVTTNDVAGVFTESAKNPKEWIPYERDETRFYNETLGTVVSLGRYEDHPEKDYVVVRLDNGLRLFFYRQSYPVYEYDVDADGKVVRNELGKYRQLPLRPAYAVTIHKSQGQTYEQANIDPYCGGSGQLYVALSRVRSVSGIHLAHKIQIWNLFLDQTVKEFYQHLFDPKPKSVIADTESKETDEGNNGALPNTDKDRSVLQPSQESSDQTEVRPPIMENASDAAPQGVRRRVKRKKGKAPTEKGGRPTRFPGGSTAVRLPNELVNVLQEALDALYPPPADGVPDNDQVEKFKEVIQDFVSQMATD